MNYVSLETRPIETRPSGTKRENRAWYTLSAHASKTIGNLIVRISRDIFRACLSSLLGVPTTGATEARPAGTGEASERGKSSGLQSSPS